MTHYNLTETFRFVYGIDNKFAGSKIERGHELIRNSGIQKSESIIIGDQCSTRFRLHHDTIIEV